MCTWMLMLGYAYAISLIEMNILLLSGPDVVFSGNLVNLGFLFFFF